MSGPQAARDILAGVGGGGNISALEHCSTRLRFSLVDDSIVDEAALTAIPGVVGVVKGPQTQVIVGTKVADYYAAIERLRGPTAAPGAPADRRPRTLRSVGGTVMDFVVSVFVPIIPAIAGAGVFKSILILLSTVGWLPSTSPNYKLLATIPDAVFAFLPILVAYTTAKKLNVNIPLALGTVALLLFPAFTTLVGQKGGADLFGLPVPVISYSAQVFPSILAVLLLSVVEKYATRWTPGPIRTFFVPMVCLIIVSPLLIFVLGPLGFWFGSLLTSAMLWMHSTLGWVAIALLAAVLPFVISVGMHKAFIPPTIAAVAEHGRESFYLVASLAHNIAELGSSFAVAIRTRNRTLRGTAISAGVSALFGITEPALYGVTLQNRRALIAVVAGSFFGGSYLGLTAVNAFVVVSPGVASFSMFIEPGVVSNVVNAGIGALIAFLVAFVVSLVLWRDGDSATLRALAAETGGTAPGGTTAPSTTGPEAGAPAGTAPSAEETVSVVPVAAPMHGEVIPLTEVDDAAFSAGVLGTGAAIRPTDGAVHAPIAGTVISMLPSGHAVGIRGADGIEVLVHVGLDTVRLEGEPFTAHAAQGDTVEAGQLLITADLDAIRAAGYDTTTPVVLLSRGVETTAAPTGTVAAGAPLFAAIRKAAHNGTV